jgi:hypothetical protein
VTEGLDRRAFLRRAGGTAAAATAATVVPGFAPFDAAAGRRALPPRLRALQRAIRGRVLFRTSPGYNRARLINNERYDGMRPLAIVRPAGIRDVQAAIQWGQRWNTRVVARSGGHSYGGYSTTENGIVVDLSPLSGVRMNGRGTATIGAGTDLIDVYAGLSRRGVSIPGGSCASVGIAGLTLGGGIGFASRLWGTTSDNLVSLQIVTANGQVLNCDERNNPELFWACRGGGGGNFGIVTNLEFKVHRATSASFFAISYPFGAASQAIDAFQRFAPETTDELFTVCVLGAGGGGASISTFGQFFGTTSRLRRLLAPLLRVPGARLTSLGSASYLAVMKRWAECGGEPLSQCRDPREAFYGKSSYVSRPLSAAGRSAVLSWIRRGRFVNGMVSGGIILDSYGGAINRVSPSATAFAHRNELYSCQFYAQWNKPAAAGSCMRWLNGFYSGVSRYMSGAAYVNYIDPQLRNWQTAYYGRNLNQLKAVKRAVDPDNFFRFRQSIPLR